jgi:hypothetical protein
MKCPICEREGFKEGRQCPQNAGKTVCVNCCIKCRYYRSDGLSCRYYIENPQPQQNGIREEFLRERRRAESKRIQADKLWKQGKKVAAYKVEEEWRQIMGRVKELEKQYEGRI